jgi:hypothetical protein
MRHTLLACSIALLLTGCPDDDPPPSTWKIAVEQLPGALISAWGTSARDVYSVGAAPSATEAPMVLHFDGTTWSMLTPPVVGVDLWWVHGWTASGPIFMGGSEGTILRYEGGTFTEMTTPGTNVIFGIWGSAPDDVWAVGGALGGAAGAFAWRYDGTEWTAQTLPAGYADGETIFKVWGRAADDVYLVGTHGKVLHWDGSAFTEEFADAGPPTMQRTLLTVHMDRDRAVAVGGFGNAVITENDGSGWRNVAGPTDPAMLGVWLTGDGGGIAVGTSGSILRRTPSGWVEEDHGISLAETLHGVWVDPDGGIWAVGGMVLAPPMTDGIILHYGPTIPTAMF